MRCPKCSTDNREGRKFCATCGTSLAIACPKCGTFNLAGEQFCGECGAALTAATNSSPKPNTATAGAATTGERRHLTILFCDLVGSVTLTSQVDPEEWRATVAGYQGVASEAISRFGGEVVRYRVAEKRHDAVTNIAHHLAAEAGDRLRRDALIARHGCPPLFWIELRGEFY